jgi:hypothetical protein
VPASGAPIFQAAAADLNPWTEAKVDTKNPKRGPLLIISGDKDHTVPWAIANASYKEQKRNDGVTEVAKIKGRGRALTIDNGWREVADTALAFVQRFARQGAANVKGQGAPVRRFQWRSGRHRQLPADFAPQGFPGDFGGNGTSGGPEHPPARRW